MLSKRSIVSLSQFLAIQEVDFVLVLCDKHGLQMSMENGALLTRLNRNFTSAAQPQMILAIVDEITRTKGDLRTRVNPKYRFDERFQDLSRCMMLDGYNIEGGRLQSMEPSIAGTHAIDDELTEKLTSSTLPEATEIIRKFNDSAESFRASPPNYNACLNDIRIALEALACAIARKLPSQSPHTYDARKWGSVIAYLRSINFLTVEEEKGLAGVYGFVSPGSHRPLGLSGEDMARLGRHLALHMCWFLIMQLRARQ